MKHFLWGILCLLTLCAHSQQTMWKRLNNSSGLNAATIICITQSHDGLIWLGTQDGLIVYNGNQFTNITPTNSKPYIESITADKDGKIWLGCRDGLRIYNPKENQWQYITQQPLLNSKIISLTYTPDSSQLYLVSSQGLFKIQVKNPGRIEMVDSAAFQHVVCDGPILWAFDKTSLVQFLNGTKKTALRNTTVWDMILMPNNNRLLVATNTGLLWINKNLSAVPIKVNAPINYPKLGLRYVFLLDGDKKHLWIKQYDSLFCLNGLSDPKPEIHTWNHLNPYSVPQQLLQLFCDAQHNIWALSGGDGIGLLPKRTRSLRFVPAEVAQTSTIWNTLVDTQSHQTVYSTQQSVMIYNHQTNIFKKIKQPAATDRFTCTHTVNFNDRYWLIGTYGSGVWLLNKYTHEYKSIPGLSTSLNINGILQPHSDVLLITTTKGAFRYSLTSHSLMPLWPGINGNILAIAPIPNKGYWLGTEEGIYRVDTSGKKIEQHFKHQLNDSTSLNDNVVFGLFRHTNGDLYVCTSNGGVNVLPNESNQFHVLPLQQNPANIYGAVGVSSDSILFVSGDGIYLYRPSIEQSKFLCRENGLQVGTFGQFGYSYNGESIYFSGGEGAILLYRSALPQLFSESLPIVAVYKNQITKHISIPAGEQQLRLEITPQNKGTLSQSVYSYQLSGLDQEWHTTNGLINYPYVPPGDYTLIVKTSDPNGINPPEQIQLSISVLPLWYQTWWFKTLVVIICVIVLIFLVRYFSYLRLQWNLQKLEAQQKVAEERLRISRELHDNVGSQLTYLITGLEASEMMLEKQYTEQLSHNLEQLHLSARDSMQQLRDAIWALNKEEMNIQLLSDRFSNWTLKMFEHTSITPIFNLTLQHNHQLDALVTLNTFRLLQECIHNILKHAKADKVEITITTKPNSTQFTINDNGVGMSEAQEGSGLTNMRIRSEQIGAKLHIISKPKEGTTINLTLQNT